MRETALYAFLIAIPACLAVAGLKLLSYAVVLTFSMDGVTWLMIGVALAASCIGALAAS